MKYYFLLISLLLLSCKNYKRYYEYYDETNYSILEVNSKNRTYLTFTSASSTGEYVSIGGDRNYSDITIYPKNVSFVDVSSILGFYTDGIHSIKDYGIYYKEDYSYLPSRLHLINSDFNKALEQKNGRSEISIPFFPRYIFPDYMERTEKIDYSKFPDNLRELVIHLEKLNKKRTRKKYYDPDITENIIIKAKKRSNPKRYELFDIDTRAVYYHHFNKKTGDYFSLKLNDNFWVNLKIIKNDGTVFYVGGIYSQKEENNYVLKLGKLITISPDLEYNECDIKSQEYTLLIKNNNNALTINLNELDSINCVQEVMKSHLPITMSKTEGINYKRFPKKTRATFKKLDVGKYITADIEEAVKKKK